MPRNGLPQPCPSASNRPPRYQASAPGIKRTVDTKEEGPARRDDPLPGFQDLFSGWSCSISARFSVSGKWWARATPRENSEAKAIHPNIHWPYLLPRDGEGVSIYSPLFRRCIAETQAKRPVQRSSHRPNRPPRGSLPFSAGKERPSRV